MSELDFQTSRDAVIGLADGAIISFAVTAGLTGANQSSELIINAGLVTAVAGALVFGLSRRSTEKTANQDFDLQSYTTPSTRQLATNLGLDEEFEKAASVEMDRDAVNWKQQLSGLDQPGTSSPTRVALTIALTFMIGAIVPVLPVFFEFDFRISIAAFVLLLLICGAAKAGLAGRNILAGAALQLMMGGAAGLLAYLVGRLLGPSAH